MHHAAVAVAGLSQEIVDAVLRDHETAPIDERMRAVLGLLKKLTLEPGAVDHCDMDELRSHGLTDEAIAEAMYVCFVFNVIDRLADAFGFPVLSAKHQARTARILRVAGYANGAIPD